MIAQQLVNGLFVGAVYALFAIGYTLVFGVLEILILAHAAIFTVAAFVAWSLLALGAPFPLALIGATIVAGLLGVALDRIAFAPLRKRNAGTLAPLISSIGVAIILGALTRRIYGVDERHFASTLVSAADLHLGALHIAPLQATIVATALTMMLGLLFIMRATPLGRSIRAVADDRVAAALLGVDLERTIAATFFIASALGGAAGTLTALAYDSVALDLGAHIELKGLAIIILGGMGSVTGAVAGALILGLVETLSVAAGLSAWREAIVFAIMLAILVVRPRGLLGKRAGRTA